MIGWRFWVLVWYGILFLGVVGLGGALYWGRRTTWKNLDEIFRGIGTILVSTGMLLLLYRVARGTAVTLLVTAVVTFVVALVTGRRCGPPPPSGSSE